MNQQPLIKHQTIDNPQLHSLVNIKRNILIIPDIHGCLEELQELVNVTKHLDPIYVSLGDLVDRGPFSYECIECVYNLKDRVMILGNHEKKLIRRLLKNDVVEGDEQKWYQKLSQEQVDNILNKFFIDSPVVLRIGYDSKIFNLAHAAIHFDVYDMNLHSYDHQETIKFKVRDTALYGYTTGKKDPETGFPERLHLKCPKENHVNVFGHIVHYDNSTKDFVFENEPGTSIYLDRGLVYGGNLTGMLITPDSKYEFINIKAKQAYMKSQTMDF